MNKYIFVLIAAVTLSSCGKKETVAKQDIQLNFEHWDIGEGALGPIKLGTHISDYKTDFTGLDSTGVDCYEYKYDGGGPAYEYRYRGRLLFTLMPAMDSDSIIAIMAIDKGFKMKNGIHPGSTIAQLKEKNGKINIRMDYLTGGEYIPDSINGTNYIFDTADDSLVAAYPDIDKPGIIKRTDVKCNWIEIKSYNKTQ